MSWLPYVVRIVKDPDSDWGASVLDLPGCAATGKTIDEALRRIEKAVALHIRGMREDGLVRPRPKHRNYADARSTSRKFFRIIEVVSRGAQERVQEGGA